MADALLQRLAAALSDRYRIERELGSGGMASVYLADDLKHPRRVAIKVLDPELALAIGPERFLREIAIVSGFTHPNILSLFDSGETDGLLYYVMPYVEGESLRVRLEREKQLPVEDALRITREVADALECAHERGVVHRDIKPENILLESGHAVVADFGIAQAAASVGREKLTTSGVTVGTPAYMSPEQSAGGHEVDGRSDQYALACVLYEMLAGQPPFTGPTAQSLEHQHLNVAPRPVTDLRPLVPAPVRDAIGKALAKTPADRYSTTGRFAAALAGAAVVSTTVAMAGRAKPRSAGRRAVVAALGAIAAYLAVAAWQAWWPFPRLGPPPAKKDWILVAAFDGPPGDSTLAPAAQSLLSAALDESRMVATVPPGQVRAALAAAGKPTSARLDPELASELAYRSAVRAVLEGTIGRLGKGYSIVLRLVDADTARVLLTESATAKSDDDLISALGAMAKRLRAGLGENRAALAATRSMNLVMTPSFEAYRLYNEGVTRARSINANRDALRYYRAALALDPDFAAAWGSMAFPYENLGYPDSALACIAEALRRPERLTTGQRARFENVRAEVDGDLGAAVAAYDRVLAEDPGNLSALTNSNDLLWRVGRVEEALRRTRLAMKLSPFGPNEAMRLNEAISLHMLGRFDEAREANRRQTTGVFKAMVQSDIELGSGRFALAESLAALPDDPRVREDWPEGLRWELEAAQFGRGAIGAAAVTHRRIEEIYSRLRDPVNEDFNRRTWLEYSVVSDGAVPLPAEPATSDTSTAACITRGLRAVVLGDQAVARRCLLEARSRPRRDLVKHSQALALLQARLETLAGRPQEAVRLLRPFSVVASDRGTSLTWLHWWLADAFERLAQPDSAAAYLERSGAIAFFAKDGVDRPDVHRRLALLYARMGRIADAERHLAAAEQAWDRPDPAVRRMLDEAQAAVRAARGMSRPEHSAT